MKRFILVASLMASLVGLSAFFSFRTVWDGFTSHNRPQRTSIFVVGRDGAYATFQLATAAGAAVGRSQVFDYSHAAQTAVPSPTSVPPFGIASMIPVPSMLALAAFGGLSLLLFRRRKYVKSAFIQSLGAIRGFLFRLVAAGVSRLHL